MSWHDEAALCARLVELGPVEIIGHTVQGRPIPALRLGTGAPGRPQLLVSANLHGPEVIGSELALRLAELLAAPEPPASARALRERADVTIVPALNLDAREPAVRALVSGAACARSPRGNARGVDLNRNFPRVSGARDAWHPLAGSRCPWLPWYRGEAPLSEPESAALAALAERLCPAVALGLHSVGRLFLHPWCCRAEAPDALAAFAAMGAAFAGAQPGVPYRVKQAHAWYTILGDLDDWLLDRFGTLAVTVELGSAAANLRRAPWRLLSGAAWMNPADPEAILAETAVPCLEALRAGLEARGA